MNALVRQPVQGALMPGGEEAADIRQFLTFLSCGELYALDILHIREIIQSGDMTVVPMMPAFVRGVINLRGKVVPVIDLARRFGQGATIPARRTSIVIVEVGDEDNEEEHQLLGIMVDAVSEVIDVSPADITPPPPFGTRIRADFIGNMARRGDGFLPVLTLPTVLSHKELTGEDVLAGIAEAASVEPVSEEQG